MPRILSLNSVGRSKNRKWGRVGFAVSDREEIEESIML